MQLPNFITNPNPEVYVTSDNWICGDLETTNKNKGDASTADNRLVYGYFYGPKIGEVEVHSELDLLHLEDEIYGADFFLAHGSKFEQKWFRRSGIKIHRFLTYDTLLGEYVRAGNRGWALDLDSCSKRHGGPGKDRVVTHLIHSGVCPSEIPTSWLRGYCQQDVQQTVHVFLRQRLLLLQEGLLAAQYLRCLTTPVLADIEMNGIHLDKELVDEIHRKYVTDHRELVRKLDAITGGINMASPAQVANFLYKDLAFEELRDRKGNPVRNKPNKQFPEGQPLTDADSIEQLKAKTKEQKAFITLKLEESKLRKKITGYTERFMYACGIPFTPVNEKNPPEKKFSKIVPGSCVIYGNLNQSIADTHRLTSSDPNLQNIDRDLKRVVSPRTEGWRIRSDDFAGIEFVTAGILTRDLQIQEDIKNKRDVHSFTAAMIFGQHKWKMSVDEAFIKMVKNKKTDKECKDFRQNAKEHTFKPLFLGTSGTKAEKAYYEEFKKRYHVTHSVQQKWLETVIKTKKLRTVTGVTFYFPDTKYTESGYVTNQSKIGNNPIQMFATADLAPTAVTLLWHYMKAAAMKSFIVNAVHDSCVTEAHPKEVETIGNYLDVVVSKDLQKLFMQLFNFDISFIPLETEADVSDNWEWSRDTNNS